MDSSASAFHVKLGWAVLVLLLAPSGGCAATSLTARYARVPVLVGPVRCIGCSGAPASDGGPGTPIADSARDWGGVVVLPWLGEGEIGQHSPAQIEAKADAVVPDACKGEVRISRLRAKSFSVVALLLITQENRIDAEGVVVPVANGTCGPRPWPYSGPHGIVMFEPTTDPGAAPVPPAPPPPGAP